MNTKWLLLVTLFISILAIYATAQSYGCQTDASYCSNNGYCNPKGFCVCNEYYYGVQCQTQISTDGRIEVCDTGKLTDASLAGIIIGWLLGVPLLIAVIYYVFYCLTRESPEPSHPQPAQEIVVPVRVAVNVPQPTPVVTSNVSATPIMQPTVPYEASASSEQSLRGSHQEEEKKSETKKSEEEVKVKEHVDGEEEEKDILQTLKDARKSANTPKLASQGSLILENILKKEKSLQSSNGSPKPRLTRKLPPISVGSMLLERIIKEEKLEDVKVSADEKADSQVFPKVSGGIYKLPTTLGRSSSAEKLASGKVVPKQDNLVTGLEDKRVNTVKGDDDDKILEEESEDFADAEEVRPRKKISDEEFKKLEKKQMRKNILKAEEKKQAKKEETNKRSRLFDAPPNLLSGSERENISSDISPIGSKKPESNESEHLEDIEQLINTNITTSL